MTHGKITMIIEMKYFLKCVKENGLRKIELSK